MTKVIFCVIMEIIKCPRGEMDPAQNSLRSFMRGKYHVRRSLSHRKCACSSMDRVPGSCPPLP